jgi:hypothetical protein
MASYTDIAPKFNPYIQQLPIEAMVQVGMEKQRRYDEGLQKIQTNIDNVAGLPVVTDLQKNYLQSKLNDLGSKLKTVAAGDFSNYQLVNSVGGMTKQIIKDPIILAAVSSATNIQKQKEFMSEERKKGNLTADNEYNYNRVYSEYLKSELTDASGKPIVFNKEYINHFDVDKFVKESFDAVKPKGWTIDQIYETDENKNIRYEKVIDPKTKQVIGQRPIVSKIASKLEQEGRLPDEVKGTLNQIFSDPRVKQQLQITGEYNYRGYSTDLLVEKIASVKRQEVSRLQESLADLNMKKAAGEDVQSNIDKLETAISSVSSEYDSAISTAKTNPDAIRGSMYMQESRNNWTKMYGSVAESKTFEDNPLFKINFELQKEANDLTMRREDMSYKWATLTETKEQNIKDNKFKEAELKLKYPTVFATPEIGAIDLAGADANIKFDDLYNRSSDIYASATDNLLFKTFLDSPKNRDRIKNFSDSGMTEEQAKAKLINITAAELGESVEGLRSRWLIKANTYLSNNPDKLDAQLQSDLVSAQNAKNVFNTLNEAKKKIDTKVPDDYKKLTASLKSITVDTNTIFGKVHRAILPDKVQEWLGMSSGKITLTPQQQYDLAMAVNGDKFGQSAAIKAEAKRAQDRLASQGIDKNSAEIITKNLSGEVTTGSSTFDRYLNQNLITSGIMTDIPTILQKSAKLSGVNLVGRVNPNVQSFTTLSKAINDPSTVLNIEKRAEAIKEFYQFNPVGKTGIITGKEEVDKVVRDDVGRFIGDYVKNGINESPGFLDNAPAMMEIVKDPKKGSMEVEFKKDEVSGQINQVIKFYNDQAQFVGEMTIDRYQASKLNVNSSNLFTMPGVKIAEMRFNSTGNGTTSYSGDVKSFDTYLQNDVLYNKDEFPLLRGQLPNSIDVRGNISSTTVIDRDGNPSTQYYNHIFVNNGGKKILKTFNVPKPNIDESIQGLNGITPQLIQQIIAENKAKSTK